MKTYLNYLKQLGLYLYHKGKAWLPSLLNLTQPARQVLKPQKRYRVDIGHPERVAILLVGCGGTGGVRRGAA